MYKKLKRKMTLKEIAIELLDKYKKSETTVIYEYSFRITEEVEELNEFCADCLELINSME